MISNETRYYVYIFSEKSGDRAFRVVVMLGYNPSTGDDWYRIPLPCIHNLTHLTLTWTFRFSSLWSCFGNEDGGEIIGLSSMLCSSWTIFPSPSDSSEQVWIRDLKCLTWWLFNPFTPAIATGVFKTILAWELFTLVIIKTFLKENL